MESANMHTIVTLLVNDAIIHRIVLQKRGEQPKTLKIWIEDAKVLDPDGDLNIKYTITDAQFSALLPYLRTYNDGSGNNLLHTDEVLKQMQRFVIDRNFTDELLALANDKSDPEGNSENS